MSTYFQLRACCALVGLLLGSLGASAQQSANFLPRPAPVTEAQQAQHLTSYLATTLQLTKYQVPALRAAVLGRLGANELLSCLSFVSGTAAASAYTTADCRYYAEVSKVLTPAQFHEFLQLDQGTLPEGVAQLVGSR